jgi:predicted transcriptional regulator
MLRAIKRTAGELRALVEAIDEEEWESLSETAVKVNGGPLNRQATIQRLTELEKVTGAVLPDEPESEEPQAEETQEVIDGDFDS